MRTLVLAVVLVLAFVAIPVDDLVVGRASAVVCEVGDVECQVRQLRCQIRALVTGGFCPA